MDQNVVLLTILGMGLVTYLPRLLPLLILTRQRAEDPARAMPPLLEAWLRHVPAAVMAAMLFPSLFIAEGRLYLPPTTCTCGPRSPLCGSPGRRAACSARCWRAWPSSPWGGWYSDECGRPF